MDGLTFTVAVHFVLDTVEELSQPSLLTTETAQSGSGADVDDFQQKGWFTSNRERTMTVGHLLIASAWTSASS